jgi:choline dehydrogenase-like flavoprotein
VSQLNALLANATTAVGGTYVGNPFYAALGQQEITVHAMYVLPETTIRMLAIPDIPCSGGACISHDGTGVNGGTNHMGEVFQGDGTTVHEGLFVCDGALVPTALGTNPFATITALAERSVELAAQKRGIDIDFDTKNGKLTLIYRRCDTNE